MRKIIFTGIVCFSLGVSLTFFAQTWFLSPLKSSSISEEFENISTLKKITGAFGEIRVIDKGNDGYSDKISLNGNVIVQNDHAGLEFAFPNAKKAEFIVVSDDCGGSSCGRASATFVDVKSDPVFFKKLPMLSPDGIAIVQVDANTFLVKGKSTYLENDLGDLLDISFLYKRKDASIKIMPILANSPDYSKFIGKHPDELLGDVEARDVFLKRMNSSIFKEFRDDMGVSSGISSDSLGMIYASTGMAPHSGGDPSAFFIIDAFKNEMFAGIFRDNKISIYTDMDINDLDNEVVFRLDKILDQYQSRWDYNTKSIISKK